MPDNRHRALLHHAFGIFLCERTFGHQIKNSDGNFIQVRDIAEQHVMEDCGGVIPTVCDYLSEMDLMEWMGGKGYPPSHKKIGDKRKIIYTVCKDGLRLKLPGNFGNFRRQYPNS